MEFILRNRRLLLIAMSMMTIILAIGVLQLRIDFSFDSFYPKNDPEYKYYEAYQELFSEEQNFIIEVAIKSTTDDIFDQPFLTRVDSIFDIMQTLPGVDSMVSATDAVRLRRRGMGITTTPWLAYDTPESLEESRQRIEQDSTLRGVLVTNDLQYVCAYIFIEPEIFDTQERDILHDELVSLLETQQSEYVITGIPVIRTRYVKKMAKELILFLSISIFLIVFVLYATYRNFWGVIIPVMVILASLLWITGTMGFSGQDINLINNLLIPIIFVVGMSDVIHLITKYLHELKWGNTPLDAMKTTLDEIGLATFLTSLTTSIGFASLMVSKIPPIREFGFYAAIGVFFTYIISITVIPNAILMLPPRIFLKSASLENHPIWQRFLIWVYNLTRRKPRQIIACTVVFLLVCFGMMSQISLDTYLLEDIGKNDPIRKSMEFFEAQNAGLRPFEMAVEMKNGNHITDREVLLEIKKIQNFLKQEGYFSPFLSPVALVEQANQFYHSNISRFRRIPSRQEDIDELIAFMELNDRGNFMDKVMSEKKGLARVSARMPDIGTDKFGELTTRLDYYIRTEIDTTLFDYQITGHAYLTDINLIYLRRSLMGGLFIAFVIIGLIMGLLFRSWKMLLISMIPNIIPLIITGGIMGLLGIKLTASTAIVFVISFGIAVDDTIHFLTRYKLERRLGHSPDVAIRNTMLGTGKAMIITSLVLMSGFVLLLASNFGGTFNTGLFTALTIVFALLSDIFLIPILIKNIEKKELLAEEME